MLGRHLLKSWSTTQPLVTLSSGEAEFHGVVKGAATGLGFQALLKDFGVERGLTVWTDSTASMGICQRQGPGRVRHLATQALWVQQRVRDGSFALAKVRGEENPADLLTKHLSSKDKVRELLSMFGCEFRDGRPDAAPALRQGEGTTKGEMLVVEEELSVAQLVAALPPQLCVAWHGQVFPRVPGGEDQSLPDAHPCVPGRLPHLHKDCSERFPRAVVETAADDDEPEEDTRLEVLGGRIGAQQQAVVREAGDMDGPKRCHHGACNPRQERHEPKHKVNTLHV